MLRTEIIFLFISLSFAMCTIFELSRSYISNSRNSFLEMYERVNGESKNIVGNDKKIILRSLTTLIFMIVITFIYIFVPSLTTFYYFTEINNNFNMTFVICFIAINGISFYRFLNGQMAMNKLNSNFNFYGSIINIVCMWYMVYLIHKNI